MSDSIQDIAPVSEPVFGFLVFSGGSTAGAIVHYIALANALHRRGYRVVVYWMFGRNEQLVDAGIRQRMVCVAPRSAKTSSIDVDDFLQTFCLTICDGVAPDQDVIRKLVTFMQSDGVTHLLPSLAMICPFALAAKKSGAHDFDYLVMFQGEEIFANYPLRAGRVGDFYRQLQEAAAGSPWPAIAVSRDYARRIRDEMGIDDARLRVIYAGTDLPRSAPGKFVELKATFPGLVPDRPIVAYVGRQDSEKGIDLLLYGVKILEQRQLQPQLVVAGCTAFGTQYHDVLRQIAQHLRLNVHYADRISEPVRNALYACSRCVVYPSIHREPFGLVAVEAMSYGIPVLVPDQGGINEVIEVEGRAGGLTFQAWNSGDLARQLERLLTDDVLHAELTAHARWVAATFGIDRLTDNILSHMGLVRPERSIESLVQGASTP